MTTFMYLMLQERELSDETTHVVVRKDQSLTDMTAKLLMALVAGKRVVTADYISKSAEQGQWLDEEPFQPFAIRPDVDADLRKGILSKWRVVLYMSECRDKNQWIRYAEQDTNVPSLLKFRYRFLYSGGAQVFETIIRDEKDCFGLKGVTHFVYREKEPLSDYLKNILLALEVAFVPLADMMQMVRSLFVQRHLALPELESSAADRSSPFGNQSVVLAIDYETPPVSQTEQQRTASLDTRITREEKPVTSQTGE